MLRVLNSCLLCVCCCVSCFYVVVCCMLVAVFVVVLAFCNIGFMLLCCLFNAFCWCHLTVYVDTHSWTKERSNMLENAAGIFSCACMFVYIMFPLLAVWWFYSSSPWKSASFSLILIKWYQNKTFFFFFFHFTFFRETPMLGGIVKLQITAKTFKNLFQNFCGRLWEC